MQKGTRLNLAFFPGLDSSPCFASWYCCCSNGNVIASYELCDLCNWDCNSICNSQGTEGFCIERDNWDLAVIDCQFNHVNLTDFVARPVDGSIQITWKTVSEIDNAGFHLWRSDAQDGGYSKITAALIPAEGGPTWGAEYEYKDIDVKPGRTYYYKLEDIDDQGLSIFHGPVSATLEAPVVPALSEWGAIVLSLILGTGAVLALRRRRLRSGI